MTKGPSNGWLRAGVAAGVSGLLLGTLVGAPAMASPDDEAIWEEGTVTSISDGDTLVANLDAGSGRPRQQPHPHDRRASTRGCAQWDPS